MMIRRSWSLREQTLAVIAAVIVIAWGIVSGLALPLAGRLAHLQQRSEVTARRSERLSTLLRRLRAIEDAYQHSAAFRSDEPTTRLQGIFLEELEQWAGAGNLSLNLKPRPPQEDGPVVRLRVEVDAEGTQQMLLAFLDHLLTGPSLVELEQLRLSATASPSAPLRATFLVAKVILRS